MKTNKRVVAAALAVTLVAGTGAAGVVNYFATSTGQGQITEAVSVTGNTGFQFSTQDAVAPETYSDILAITNNNPDDEVDYTWQLSGDDGESYVNAGVYRVDSFPLVQSGDPSGTNVSDTYHVNATPSLDTIEYQVELPSDYFDVGPANVNLEISPTGSGSEDNYQVTYYGGSDTSWDWRFKNDTYGTYTTVEGTETDVETVNDVVDVGFDSSGDRAVVTVEVTRPDGNQSFMVQASDGGEAYNTFHTESYEGFNGQSVEYHEETGIGLVGQEVALDGAETQRYNFVTEFTEQTGTGTYEVKAQAVP